MLLIKNKRTNESKNCKTAIWVIYIAFLSLIITGCASTNSNSPPKPEPGTYNNARHNKAVNYITANLESLAKSLPEETSRASSADVNSFEELKLIWNEFDYYLNQFQSGNPNIGLRPIEDKRDLLAIYKLWVELKDDIESILRAEGTVRMVSIYIDTIVETTPLLSKISTEIVDELKNVNAASNQYSIASQQLVLLSRISNNARQLLHSGNDVESKVAQISKDAASFQRALDALISGDSSMGLKKVENQNIQHKLSDVKELIESAYPMFNRIQENVGILSSFQDAVTNTTLKVDNLVAAIEKMKQPDVDQVSVAQNKKDPMQAPDNEKVTLSVVYFQLEQMTDTLFRCRLALNNDEVPSLEIDKITENCVAKLGVLLDALQKNKNDVLFIKSENGKYYVNDLRSLHAKFKISQGDYSKYSYNKKILIQDANKILSDLPYFIDQLLILGSKAFESGETAVNVYVIMRQVYMLQRLEENIRKIMNVKNIETAGVFFDKVGRDAALFIRVSDALVNSSSKMRIRAVVNTELNKELFDLLEKFKNEISIYVGKILDYTPKYFDNIQANNDMEKYLDEMIVVVDNLRSKYKHKKNSGEFI